MRITNGQLVKDATPEQAEALAAAGWTAVTDAQAPGTGSAPSATGERQETPAAAAPAFSPAIVQKAVEGAGFSGLDPEEQTALRESFPTSSAAKAGRSWEEVVAEMDKYRTPEVQASRMARESPESVRLVDALFPRTMAAGRMEPDQIAFPWQMAKDIASLPGRIATSEDRAEIADPIARAELEGGRWTSPGAWAERANALAEMIAVDPTTIPLAVVGGPAARGVAQGVNASLRPAAQAFGVLEAARIADRATDRTPTTSPIPGAGQIATDAALAVLPDAIIAPAGRFATAQAKKVAKSAPAAFLRMMKFLPGQQRMAVWKAGKEFAEDPALRAEVLKGAKTVPDVAANFERGKEQRLAEIGPAMAAADATGKLVSLREAVQSGRRSTLEMEPGTASPKDRAKAVRWIMERILVPPKGEAPEWSRVVTGVLPDGSIQTVTVRHPEGLPLNAVERVKPTEARPVKTNLYHGIDCADPAHSEAREVAMEGAARSIREQIEAIDPTGTIAQKNRAAGKFLAAERGFQRAVTRDANRGKEGILAKIGLLPPRDTPAAIRRLDLLARLYAGIGKGLESPTTAGAVRAPILSGRHAAGALPPDLDPETLFPVRRDSIRRDSSRSAR